MTPTPLIPDRHRDALIDELERAVDRERPVDIDDNATDPAHYTCMRTIGLRNCIADAIRAWERQVGNLTMKGKMMQTSVEPMSREQCLMNLLEEAEEILGECVPNGTWWKRYLILSGGDWIQTEEGWEPESSRAEYLKDDPGWEPLDEIKESRPPADPENRP